MNMSKYVRLTKGLNDKGHLISPNDIEKTINGHYENDFYTSVYYYSDKHFKKFQETKSVKGIVDVVTDKLIFDLDSKDLNYARVEAIELIARLSKYIDNPDDIEIYFSGNKGFTLVVNLPREITPDLAAKLAIQKFGKGLQTLDTTVYNASRILRVPGTKHPSSGLHKIPLTKEELETLYPEEIRDMAKDSMIPSKTPATSKVADAFFDVSELPIEKRSDPAYDITSSVRPKNWTNCKWSLLQGNFKSGERNKALTIIAATCRGLGFTKDMTYDLCKGALRRSHEKFGKGDFTKDELYQNIIEQSIYTDNWKGGQYTCKKDPWLSLYCENLGENKCKVHEEEASPAVSLEDMKDRFFSYAKDFDKNKIKFGLDGLDSHVTLCTSTLNGLLGQPGCHAKGSKILMYDGSIKNVEDINVGDLLMGPDSSPREVLKLQRGKDKMFKIKPIKGEEFIVNQHHILNLKPSTGTNNKAFECNLNIMLKDYIERTTKVVKQRYKVNRVPIEFSTKENQSIDPYILGLWLGDGHSHGTQLTTMDSEIRDAWISYGRSLNLQVKEYRKEGEKCAVYSLSNNGDNEFLRRLHHFKLIDNKHIPLNYLTGNKNQRLEILAGLLDTDGSLESHNKKHFDYISKLKNLSESVVYICRSLGLAAYMSECKKGCMYKDEYKEGTYYRVSISGDVDIIPTRLPRKKALKRLQVKDPLVTGFFYEELGEGDYYGFTLDKDHLYLTSDFIVHHNSGKTSAALQYVKNTSGQETPSMFFSLDMGEPIVFAKIIQNDTGWNFDKVMEEFRSNKGTADKIAEKALDKYKNVAMNFRSGLTVADIKSCIEKQSITNGVGKEIKLVIIDYLECIAGPYSDQTANTGFIANQLKDLANELQVCVLLLLQTQKHSTPNVSDPLTSLKGVKGSSLIEQSCTTILTLWRTGYDPDYIEDDKFISFAVVKNRFGPLWKGDFSWDGPRGNISHLSSEGMQELKDLKKRKEDDRIRKLKDDVGWE